LQLVPFYYYGNPSGAPPLTDWNVFGFGTEVFRSLFKGALEAAVENNILMDFALGASQGQGTPAEPRTEGLSLQLVRVPSLFLFFLFFFFSGQSDETIHVVAR
jgi:hypothetical protein